MIRILTSLYPLKVHSCTVEGLYLYNLQHTAKEIIRHTHTQKQRENKVTLKLFLQKLS